MYMFNFFRKCFIKISLRKVYTFAYLISVIVASWFTTRFSVKYVVERSSDVLVFVEIILGTIIYFFITWGLSNIYISLVNDNSVNSYIVESEATQIDYVMSFVITVIIVAMLGLKSSAIDYYVNLNNIDNATYLLGVKFMTDVIIYWIFVVASITKLSLQFVLHYIEKRSNKSNHSEQK